jgi:hypothetical protein
MKKNLRQGDVLLLQIAQLPRTCAPAQTNTLAEGELSGHHHNVYGCEVLADDAGNLYLQSNGGGAQLKHEDVFNEHAPTGDHADLQIPPGIYAVVQQRQYDPRNPFHNPYVKD